jgi:hypothetical protein
MTDHTTADQTLDEILENIAASTGFYADDIFTVIHPEAKAALLRWHTAGVRAVVERLLDKGYDMTIADRAGNHLRWWPDGFRDVLYDELHKLTEDQNNATK